MLNIFGRGARLGSRATAVAFTALILASCGGSDDNNKVTVTSMAVFGDSLSDLGTYAVPAVTAVGGGRFTTNTPGAKFWSEHVSDYYGVSISRNRTGGFGSQISVLGGTSYAEGGARVTLQPGIGCTPDGAGGCTLAGALTRPVTQQVQAHLAASGGRIPQGQLVMFFAGANDIFVQAGAVSAAIAAAAQQPGATPQSIAAAQAAAVQLAQQALGVAATTLAQTIRSVVSAGGTLVAVITVPDIGLTPSGLASASTQQLLSGLTATFNGALAQGLAGAANVTTIPSNDFFTEAIANPARYGFVNVTQPACNIAALPNNSSLFCSGATLVAPNAQANYLFADAVHPTVGTHQQFGSYVINRLRATIGGR
ncbi:MAG: SGNH/GDSL hydrolase family protein [Burkholderiales bacterium]|nr:SGNH/GDSL hydrolase family protein [Burkholderiales bacterium]